MSGIQKQNVIKLDSLAADPAAPGDGSIWHNDTDDRLKKQLNGATETIACLSDIPVVPELQCGKEPIASFALNADGVLEAAVSFATAFAAPPGGVVVTVCGNGCTTSATVDNASITAAGFTVCLGTNDATDLIGVSYVAC